MQRFLMCTILMYFASTLHAQREMVEYFGSQESIPGWRYGSFGDTAVIIIETGKREKKSTMAYNLATGRKLYAAPVIEGRYEGAVQFGAPFQINENLYYTVESKQIKRLDTWKVKYRYEFYTSASLDKAALQEKVHHKKLSRAMEDARILAYNNVTHEFIFERDQQILAIDPQSESLQERLIFKLGDKISVSKYAFSRGGRYIIATSVIPSIKNFIIHINTGKLYLDLNVSAFNKDGNAAYDYVFTPNDSQVLVNDRDEKAHRLYNMPSAELVKSFPYSLLSKAGNFNEKVYFDNQYLYLVMDIYLDKYAPLKEMKRFNYPIVQVFKQQADTLVPVKQYWLSPDASAYEVFKGTAPATPPKKFNYDQLPKEHAKLLSYFKPIQAGFTLDAFRWDSAGFTLVDDRSLIDTWCFITCQTGMRYAQQKNLYALGKLYEDDKTTWLLAGTSQNSQVLTPGQPYEMTFSVHRYDKVDKRFRQSEELGMRMLGKYISYWLLEVVVEEVKYNQVRCINPVNTYTVKFKE